MLQKLNEKTQGVVAWFIIILIAITFALFGLNYYSHSGRGNQAKATVNGYKITQQAFDSLYRRLKNQQSPELLSAQIEQKLKQSALKQLVTNTLSKQYALDNGFYVSPEQAKQAIRQIPQFQQQGQFSPELYQQVLSQAYYTPDSFLQEVQQGMLLNQQRFSYVGTSFALPDEINRYISLIDQRRNYRYLTVYAPSFYGDIKPTDKEIKAYYQANQALFMTPEQVSLQYVELAMPAMKQSISISDEQVKQYYDDNISSYRQPAKWQVSHILLRLPKAGDQSSNQAVLTKAQDLVKQLQQDPKLFSQFVKKYSDDKLSLLSDGKLPWISATAGPNAMELALLKLTKPGQISQPIKTKFGYEIVKVLNYKASKVTPFAEVKSAIHEQLVKEQAQKIYADKGEILADVSYQTPDSLTDVSQQLKLPLKSTPLFSKKGDSKDALLSNKQVLAAAFSDDVLVNGNNSEPLQLSDDSVVVVRVKEHIKAKPKSLEQVKAVIKQRLIKQQAASKAKKLGEQIVAMQQSPDKLNNLILQNKLKWKLVNKAKRQQTETNPAVNNFAFTIADLDKLQGKSLANGDFIIVDIQKIIDGKRADVSKERLAILKQQIQSSNGLRDFDLLIGNLVKNAKVES